MKPEHILVLFHKSEEFADLDRVIRSKDVTGQIKGFVKPHYENKDEYIFKEHHLTLSTTFSAKGYDAYVVFIAGADVFDIDEPVRASFYVGATRARLILNVSGLDRTRTLFQEAFKIRELLEASLIQVHK